EIFLPFLPEIEPPTRRRCGTFACFVRYFLWFLPAHYRVTNVISPDPMISRIGRSFWSRFCVDAQRECPADRDLRGAFVKSRVQVVFTSLENMSRYSAVEEKIV